MKKVLVLSGSPRTGGNSDLLCDEFMRGAKDAGNSVTKIRLSDKKIHYCHACYHCRENNGICAIKDDMENILDLMMDADVIVMASPVYFYSIDAQMKTVIDRALAKWTKLKDKEFYYIMTAAENSPTVMDCTLECFRGFAKCLHGSQEKGVIYGKGVYEKEAVRSKKEMQQAYEMGTGV